MNRVVKYRRVTFKKVLGPIAVMDIKVHNAYPFYLPFLLNIAGRNGDIVKVTKSHGFVDFGMVTGWSNGAKRIVEFVLHYQADGL